MGLEFSTLVVLTIAGTSLVAPIQSSMPRISVNRQPNNVYPDAVVQCNWRGECIPCRMRWSINGSAVSGPDYTQEFKEDIGIGILTFTANSSFDGMYVRCILEIRSEDSMFHCYISDPAVILFEVLATTAPVKSVTSQNNLTSEKMEVSESGSGLVLHNETGPSNNTVGDQWNTASIVGTCGSLLPVIIFVVVVGFILSWYWKKKRRYKVTTDPEQTNPPNTEVHVEQELAASVTKTTQITAEETNDQDEYDKITAEETNDQDEYDKFTLPLAHTTTTVAALPVRPKNSIRCSRSSATHRQSELPNTDQALEKSGDVESTKDPQSHMCVAEIPLEQRGDDALGDQPLFSYEDIATKSSIQLEITQPPFNNGDVMSFTSLVATAPNFT